MLCLFVLNHTHQEFIDFETRFALFAQDMFRHGVGFFPTIHGKAYPDYLSTSTLLIYLSSLPFGEVTKLSAVLPTAIASALTLMFVYLIGATVSRRWGFYAVLMSLMTGLFFASARTISMDQFVVLVTTMSFYFMLRDMRVAWLVLLCMVGFLFRGAVGFVIPAGVVVSFYFATCQWRRVIFFGLLAGVALILCGAVELYLAYLTDGHDFVQQVLDMQLLNRVSVAVADPWWYYFAHAVGDYAIAFELALMVVLLSLPILLKHQTNKEHLLLRGLFAWVLIVMLGMSIPQFKHSRYILPIAPALALLAAYLFAKRKPSRSWFFIKRCMAGVFFIMPTLVTGLLLLFHHRFEEVSVMYIVVFFIALQILAIGFRKYFEVTALVVAAICYVVVMISFVEPLTLQRHAAQSFVQQVERVRLKTHAPLYFYHYTLDGDVIRYLVNVREEVVPSIAHDLKKLPKNAVVIMPKKTSIPFKNYRVIARGQFGHRKAVAIYLIQ
ncbi:MAG: ArnT family glycosyltransferase [Gammaproteobacteria bacterium]